MLLRFSCFATLALVVSAACASEFDNVAGRYTFNSLPTPAAESRRMNSNELSDQQPAGRYVNTGENLTIRVSGLRKGYHATAVVGFRQMWGSEEQQQDVPLRNGDNALTADQTGPLFIRFNAPDGAQDTSAKIDVTVSGGNILPLYVDGQTSAIAWQSQMKAYPRAPFLQLFSPHSMVTLTSGAYRRAPIADPAETMHEIENVLALETTLAGFDDSGPKDRRSPLRQHYLVDYRSPPSLDDAYYMYASNQFIGMRPDNTGDLTDPARLRTQWAIWHETGHTLQQRSWTWDTLTEVDVNLFSLYVQEKMGQPNRLDVPEDGVTPRERAQRYLKDGPKDFVANDENYFERLVMFDDLRQVYGWDFYTRVFKYYRQHPLPDDADTKTKVDQFVIVFCKLSGNDLRPFFEKWGLRASARAYRTIDAMRLPVRAI